MHRDKYGMEGHDTENTKQNRQNKNQDTGNLQIPEILVFLFQVHNRDQRENGSKGDTIDYIKNAPHFIEMLNT